MIITIDGPAGTGKSTVARKVAEKLSFVLLDTGALYRAVAYALMVHNINLHNSTAISTFLAENALDILSGTKQVRYVIGGIDATDHIRTIEVGTASSIISAHPVVRAYLLPIQRSFAFHQDVVCEGRDVGTTVFPTADIKVFLTASPDIRAERRWKEMKGSVSLNAIKQEIAERDYRDSTRTASPLTRPKDSVLIDTSDLTIEQVVNQIASLAKAYPHWEHFDHQSDIGIRGIGATPAEAFAQAALALTAVITDPASVSQISAVRFDLPIQDLESLFFDFLNHILFEMDARSMLFSRVEVTNDEQFVHVTMFGEPVSVEKHHPTVEVKAATYSDLLVRRRPDTSWVAQCVVDV